MPAQWLLPSVDEDTLYIYMCLYVRSSFSPCMGLPKISFILFGSHLTSDEGRAPTRHQEIEKLGEGHSF